MGGQHHAPTAFPPVRRPSTYCQWGLVGPSAGLDGAENLFLTGIQSPDRRARGEYSLYLLRCRDPH